RLQNEYNRLETLFQQKAATERERVTAESEYKSLLATYNSLAMKINHFGIDKTPIEDGQFYLTFPIKAPIDGYITEIKSTLGETITSETILTELVNPYSLALKISIFPESISKIAVGQPIRLKTAQNKPKFLGNITAVGLSVDNNSKTVFCSGSIEGIPTESRLMNQYLEVEIITNTDSLPALPKSAIHKNENGTYVFKLNRRDTNSYHFEKFYIKTGREWQDLIEIIDFPPDITILIQGGYNLSSGH
ncbi:MAG TPA: efflux RND transporter periplasmic adaptor subunit, partial [Salinivirgaceae bacterium]|nr:efflux RND transporter periplasmic adaptor subunit [Salinivirgaceae bacterium]